MKLSKIHTVFQPFRLLGLILPLCVLISAQLIQGSKIKYTSHNEVQLMVSGTSTLHDWDMHSHQGEMEAIFMKNPSGVLKDLVQLSFKTQATSLKGPYDQMNKLAHAALKSDLISFVSDSSHLTVKNNKQYHAETFGKLQLADTSRNVRIEAEITVLPDQSLHITGQKSIKMTDYHMVPPSFMMGAFQVDKTVILKFNLIARP